MVSILGRTKPVAIERIEVACRADREIFDLSFRHVRSLRQRVSSLGLAADPILRGPRASDQTALGCVCGPIMVPAGT